ncbi:dihydropteroate synthase [Ascidiimonas aurantiaca]|uniref:dihydropteroate synthase n=1 Tax=Ascidiimonas aurantiaca TaxID=1685432 RepID=UPI0030EE16EE
MYINCKGTLVDLSTPRVMGILNLTPDSFYDGGRYADRNRILQKTEQMLEEGAAFIDVGGYSSRPGALEIPEEEELKRVLPAITGILERFPDTYISVDTFRSSVARAAVEAGAVMINDISAGLLDTAMLTTIGELQVPYCMMHMQGTPQTMQNAPVYTDILQEVLYFFSERIAAAREKGIHDLIIDPGFGFGKTLEHNYELLSKMESFCMLDHPLLIGVSRKSMIYKPLNTLPENALNGTTALHMAALAKGAAILRVHDVKEAMECITLSKLIYSKK